jgi:hypothetical protein
MTGSEANEFKGAVFALFYLSFLIIVCGSILLYAVSSIFLFFERKRNDWRFQKEMKQRKKLEAKSVKT